MDDFELLKAYADQGSQPAFRQLVERHVALVYAAARRQLRSPELAQEVTQGVFAELASQARKLRSGQPLGAWLHVVTRRRAIDGLRRESRRRQRELTAVQIAAVDAPSSNWSRIEPLLDEAIASLDPADRNAVVARFLENKSLREVGLTMGASEDAAQKRVSRALDRLREFFGRRGITATAAGLAAEISAHAVEAAPTGFAAIILPLTLAIPAATSLVPQLLMTTAQKLLIGAGLIAAVGTIWYQHQVIVRQEQQLAALANQADGLHGEVHRLSTRAAQLSTALEKEKAQSTPSSSPGAEEENPELRILLARVAQLKQRLKSHPQQGIPEMQYLKEQNWISEAGYSSQLKTANDFIYPLARLRSTASGIFIGMTLQALEAYVKASGGVLPTDMSVLAPYADPPLDLAALQRYRLLQTGLLSEVPPSAMLIEGNPDLLVDKARDSVVRVGIRTRSTTDGLHYAEALAKTAFREANNGQESQDPKQLLPYFKDPDLAKAYLDNATVLGSVGLQN